MQLRPDITDAAARLTSGFDVSRELRQLSAHLREGESVYRLAAGVYGSGGGLLAVTNRRVLLLRDGRSGQASEGFPLERVTSVRWVGGPARGAIVVHDAHSTAELTQVEPGEGTSVVAFIRSLLPEDLHEELDSYQDADLEVDERSYTHGSLALAAAASTANGVATKATNGTAVTATRSGRFAVPMRLRATKDISDAPVGRLPEQKTGEPVARATAAPEPDVDRDFGRDQAVGRDQGYSDQGYSDQGYGRDRYTGRDQDPVRDQFAGRDQFGGRDQDFGRDQYPSSDQYAGSDQFGGRDQEPGADRVNGTFPHEVPVSRLAEETGGNRAVSGTGPRERRAPRSEFPDDTGQIPAGRAARRADPGPDTTPTSRRAGLGGLRGLAANQPRKRLLVIGSAAAGVLALAVVGSVVLVSHNSDSAAVNPAPAAADLEAGTVVTVTKVIDGDSIEVAGQVTGPVEVVGIIAPRPDKEQCGAADSTGFATRSLSGSKVTLISDPSQPTVDSSGRRLASLRLDSGLDYAVLATQAGMARYYEGTKPVAQAQQIKDAQAEAEKADRGLWGAPCKGKTSSAASTSTGTGTSKSTASSSKSTAKESTSKPASSSTGTDSTASTLSRNDALTEPETDTGSALTESDGG